MARPQAPAHLFDPASGPCQRLAPSLAVSSEQVGSSGILPVIVSTGDVETNRRVLPPQAISCPILLQEKWELARLYEVRITPLAYLIDEEGRIASAPAVGPDHPCARVG